MFERRISMKMFAIGGRSVLFLLLVLMVSACTVGELAPEQGAAVEAPAAEPGDKQDAVVEPDRVPDPPALTQPPLPPSQPRNDKNLNSTDDLLRIPGATSWQTAITGGRRITVTFKGGKVGNFESPCAWDYRLETEEDDELVVMHLRATRILRPGAHVQDCPRPDTDWAITTTLEKPFGNRHLRDVHGFLHVRPAQVETRLVPTWLPDEWVATYDDQRLPLQVARFGLDDEPALIEVRTSPISINPRLSTLRTFSGWEPTTIRRDDDGALVINDDRSVIVGFEEQGWYYRIEAQPGIDPATVLEFARKFERPALIEGDLPAAFTDVVTTLPPQPGQEEGEARPLQGVLPSE